MCTLYKALFGKSADSEAIESEPTGGQEGNRPENAIKPKIQCDSCGEILDPMDMSALDHECATNGESGAHSYFTSQVESSKLRQDGEADFHVAEGSKVEKKRKQKTSKLPNRTKLKECDSFGRTLDPTDPSGSDHECGAAGAHSDITSQVEDLKISQDAETDLRVDDGIKEQWEREQKTLKQQLVLDDVDDWARFHVTAKNVRDFPGRRPLEYIGGVDISFVKGDNVNACAALVVVKLPALQVVYQDLSMVALTAPYIPGFLAFREADFLVEKVEKLKKLNPQFVPQVIMVDGNGILHPREFGLASQLGVLLDIPALGVAKKLFQVDGLEKNDEHKKKILKLEKGGDTFPLIGASGKTLGLALRSCNKSTNPIFVSQGHKISLKTALWVTNMCCKYRIPEPTRQADLKSRDYLQRNFKPAD